MKKILVTGGNKSVYKSTHAIELYDSNEDCVKKINDFLNCSDKDKKTKKAAALQAYEKNYTLECFAKNYDALVTKIDDLGENI